MLYPEDNDNQLSQDDQLQALTFAHHFKSCNSSENFHNQIHLFATFLGFKYVLYGYTACSYDNRLHAHFVNISNPQDWVAEYTQKQYMLQDPLVYALEQQLALGNNGDFIFWDNYDWILTKEQQQVVERRRFYNLNYGCSIFSNSTKKDFSFFISFADSNIIPDARTEALIKLVITELMVTKKRLIIQELVGSLSQKQWKVAEKIMSGETNKEIAKNMNVTENTVKFHIKNIFEKLEVRNRQQAIGVLLAERYLSP